MTLMLDELIDAIEHGTPLVSNGDTATRALESIVGIYTSSRNGGNRIAPADLDRSMTIRSN